MTLIVSFGTTQEKPSLLTELFFVYETPRQVPVYMGINRHLIFYISHSVQFVGVITAVFSTS